MVTRKFGLALILAVIASAMVLPATGSADGLPMLDVSAVVTAVPPEVGGLITITVTVRDGEGALVVGCPVTIEVYQPDLSYYKVIGVTGANGQYQHQLVAAFPGDHCFISKGNWPGHLPGIVFTGILII